MKTVRLLLFALAVALSCGAHAQIGPTPGGGPPSGPAGGCLTGTYPAPGLASGCLTGGLPAATAPGQAPVSGAGPSFSYTAQAVSSQSYATARQTYVLEDYLSSADGHGGTDYGYALTNFCTTVGCTTLTQPVALKTTHAGQCAVYTTMNIPAPIVFDGASCTFVPQSTMASTPVSLTSCSTTIGSTAVTCTSTTGLSTGMAVGGDPTVGPENYVASVTNGTTFQLALASSRNFLGIPTNGTATVKGIDSMIDAASTQSITGTCIPASTTISSISASANTWTMSANSTCGTLSPVDLQLAPGTVVSGLALTAVQQTPVILVPPSNTSTSQAKPHGPNYGVTISNTMIRDPQYSHSSFGRSLSGVVGIQAYGQDNLTLHNVMVAGIKGSALIYGGYVPSTTADGSNVVRESDVDGLYAYSDGDITTGQACLALMTGLGEGDTTQDELNQDGFKDFHCVYPDAEGLVIGSYLHPGTTNGPRLLTFTGDNQFEAGSDSNFSFGASDMVRVLTGGGYNKILGGRWDTPGFGKSTFRISSAIDWTITGSQVGASGGSSEIYNVGLTGSSTAVTYTSAGTGGGTSFVTGPYWNGVGAQLNDGVTCTPCNVWLATTGAVNGAGTQLTLSSAYTGSQTTGTLTIQGGGYYFHLDQALSSQLNAMANSYIDQASPVITLLSLGSATNGYEVGTGSLVSTPPGLTDHLQSWSLNNLILPPTSYTANSSSRNINFEPAYLNSSNIYQTGQVSFFASVGSGANPNVNINSVCVVCGGDFHLTFQNNLATGGSFMDIVAGASSLNAYLSENGNGAAWQEGLKGTTSWNLFDKTNSTNAITVTPSTEAVVLTGPLSVPSVNKNVEYFGVDSGTGAAYVITTTPTVSALTTGMLVWFIPANNSSSATPTLNLDGLGAVTITQLGNNALIGVPIQTTSPALVAYNGTNWVLITNQQPNSFYAKGVLFPSAPSSGCVLNALNSTNYQCTTGTVVPVGGYYGGTSTGAVNVLAISLSSGLGTPTLANLTGVPITLIPNLANTTTNPTLTVNSLAATTIVKGTSTALVAGDLALSTPAVVIYNGTNFVLQNPVVGITQTQTSSGTNFLLNGTVSLGGGTIQGTAGNTNVTITGGQTNGSGATAGNALFVGGNTSTATSTAGNATLEAGASTGATAPTQGMARIVQSFTIASATTVGFAMHMTSTSDVVAPSTTGSTNNVGIATTVGGTNAQIYVASHGKVLAVFDGTPTVGDVACYPLSGGTTGLLHDNGSTSCTLGEAAGVVTGQVSGTGSGATATVELK